MSTLGIIASSHKFEAGRVTINLTIAANTFNYNIVSNRGGTYDAGNTDVTLTINSGVTVGSTSTFTPALVTGSSWTTGDTITIINNGTIKGLGGNGGNGGSAVYNSSVTAGTAGGVGGRAVRCQFTTTFTNNGSVYGGGGGGGGGGSSYYQQTVLKSTSSYAAAGGGGGGGAGVNAGSGGTAGTASGATNNFTANNGSNGTATAGGDGGVAGGSISGGAGGGLGANGSAGNNGITFNTPTDQADGGAGGTRGHYEFNSKANINGGAGIGGTVGGRSS